MKLSFCVAVHVLGTACASAHAASLATQPSVVTARLVVKPVREVSTKTAANTRTVEAPAETVEYVVQPGDTLWRISQRFAVSVTDLQSRNNLKTNSVKVGQKLRVIDAAPAKTTTTPKLTTPTTITSTGSAASTAGRDISLATSTISEPAIRSVPDRKYSFIWPVEGILTSRFGKRDGKTHDGIDIGAPSGSKVRAAADGDVIYADSHAGYGNLVLIRHARGLVTVYAHNSKVLVNKGQRVKAGQTIAAVGSTGHSTGPHLHFEVRRGVQAENPLGLLPP
ncbi:MAG: peptidoglycan DD-metalloendopeptidase family protein [Clostridia bacterium]|nr:peptidoglycan DD-metalloendopeptidase family protein [Deltaproteobacteria bacterium]